MTICLTQPSQYAESRLQASGWTRIAPGRWQNRQVTNGAEGRRRLHLAAVPTNWVRFEQAGAAGVFDPAKFWAETRQQPSRPTAPAAATRFEQRPAGSRSFNPKVFWGTR